MVGGAIAAPLAGGAAYFGAEWSLRLAFLVFVVGTVAAILLPAQVDSTEGEQAAVLRPDASDRSRSGTNIPPAVAFALRANCGPRWLSGFLTMYMAFLLRDHPLPGWEGKEAILLGIVIGGAGAGNTIGIFAASVLKNINPSVTVMAALLADVAIVALGALFYGVAALAGLGLVAGLAQSLAKVSLDSTIQGGVPVAVQASAFARSDTTLQLAWVIGGFVGIALPQSARLGLGVGFAVLAAWTLFVLSSRPRRSRGRPRPRPAERRRPEARTTDRLTDAHGSRETSSYPPPPEAYPPRRRRLRHRRPTRRRPSGASGRPPGRRSELELVGQRAQHLRGRLGGAGLRVAAVAVALADAVEEPDEVLDDRGHLLGLLAARVGLVARDRGRGLEHAHLQRLVAATTLGDAELDPGARLDVGAALGQRVGVHVDVGPAVLRQEPEALRRGRTTSPCHSALHLPLSRNRPTRVRVERAGPYRAWPTSHDGKPRRSSSTTCGAGRLELGARAAAGEHRDARHPRRERALDVVHVVADVGRGPLPPQRVGLAGAPHPALERVDVEPEVVEVQLCVGGGTCRSRPRPGHLVAHRRDGLGRPRQERDRGDGVVGVELTEAVARRSDASAGRYGASISVERRPEGRRHLLDREVDAELGAERGQHRPEPRSGVDERHVEVEPDDRGRDGEITAPTVGQGPGRFHLYGCRTWGGWVMMDDFGHGSTARRRPATDRPPVLDGLPTCTAARETRPRRRRSGRALRRVRSALVAPPRAWR